MAHTKKKQRGGGKKKTLFSTTEVTYSLINNYPPEIQKKEIEAMNAGFKRLTLKSKLTEAEETAIAILKQHDLPATWPEVLRHSGDYNLPLPASYAADILCTIHILRDHFKKNNIEGAVNEALKLGCLITCHDAEIKALNREGSRTSVATDKRQTKKGLRQERMEKIALETGWQQGQELSKTRLQGIYTLLRERYPEYTNKPKNQTLSDDAQEIGLR